MRISISRIKLFKACRRAYQLKYEEGLEPVEKAESLQTGATYHEKIERFNKGDHDVVDGNTKEDAMVYAYIKYIAPKLDIDQSEVFFDANLNGNQVVGIVDAICKDGTLVEYKTTSVDLADEYEYMLQWDEQLLMYMWLTGKRSILYVICRKPTIRQKKNESELEFFNRMCEWYDEDTDSKIKLIRVERTNEEIEQFANDLSNIVMIMNKAEPEDMYRNTGYCKVWGRMCDYAPVCLHYDKNANYIEFVRKEVP